MDMVNSKTHDVARDVYASVLMYFMANGVVFYKVVSQSTKFKYANP